MIITNNLPRFDGEKAVFAVLGKQVAKIYLIHGGVIEKKEGIEVETPRFSDRESFFQRAGRGQVYASGSVYESQDDYIISTFTSQLARHLRTLISELSPDSIYLFMPAHLKSVAKARLNKPEQALVREEFYGNYVDFHPFTLLTMIKERQEARREENSVVPLSNVALKILRKKDILDDSDTGK